MFKNTSKYEETMNLNECNVRCIHMNNIYSHIYIYMIKQPLLLIYAEVLSTILTFFFIIFS